ATANSSMRLLGIIFSKSHAQSHAVLQGNDGVSRRYIVGSQLPNGARLVDISKRQITYEFDGIQTHLALPPVKP
ncbi:MAG: type II secretion system protein N, partial [Comamonas sp.]